MNKSFWEAKLPKEIPQENPLNRVKGLSKINLHKTARRRSFPAILLKKLLDQINIITH
jgi:hypothetical protein